MTRSRWARLSVLAATCNLACGSSQSSQPSPTPTPVSTRAFIYLLHDQTLDVFEVVPATGVPVQVGSLAIPGADNLAIDSRGRFVYVSVSSSDGGTGVLRSYRVDPSDASLHQVSERRLRQRRPNSLQAGDGYVVAGWSGYHAPTRWTVSAVDASGALLSMSEEYPPSVDLGGDWFECSVWWLPGLGASRDMASLVVYDRSGHCDVPSAVNTVRVEGSALRPVGSAPIPAVAHLDDADVMGAVSVSGQIVFLDTSKRLTVVAVDPSDGHLVVRGQFADPANYAFSPRALSAAPSGDRLAILEWSGTLSVYSLLEDGQLVPTDRLPRLELPSHTWIAFHPTGRFLYASLAPGLTTYAIGSDGKLTEIGVTAAAPGTIVAGLPPS